MGMLIYDAMVLTRIAPELSPSRSVLTLGVPLLNFSADDYRRQVPSFIPAGSDWNYKTFFHALGFQEVDALDISDYEGASIIGDLNDPNLADRIGRKYDLVYDCGTLEHIFDAAAALRTINRLINLNGMAVHSTPANGFMDHGFWQLSPNLFRTFYRATGFDILTSALFVLGDSPVALPALQNIYRIQGRAFITRNIPEAIAVFAARKRRNMLDIGVALQDYYSQMHANTADDATMVFFLSFGSPARARLYRNPILRTLLLAIRAIRAKLAALSRILSRGA